MNQIVANNSIKATGNSSVAFWRRSVPPRLISVVRRHGNGHMKTGLP